MKKCFSILSVFCLMAMLTLTGCKGEKKEVSSGKTNQSVQAGDSSGEENTDVTGESSDVAGSDVSQTDSGSGNSSGSSIKGNSSSAATTAKKAIVKDLKGYTFTFAVAKYGDAEKIKLGVSDYMDAEYQRNKKIEKDYNCKIKYEYYEPTTIFNMARASIMSGDKFADAIVCQLFPFGALYINKLLYNLNNLPDLNLKSNAWIPEYTNKATFKDGVYGIAGEGLTPTSHFGVAVHYNKTLLKKLNLTDPASLVKSNKWTWDKFREMMDAAKKDLNNDGHWTAADRWGCSSASYDGIVPFFFSTGCKAMIKKPDGKIAYNLNNTTSISALLKFGSLFTIKDGAFFASNYNFNAEKTQYTSGKSLFYLSVADDKLEDMNDEDAVVPVPKYTSSSPYISATGHNAYIICVPKTITDKSKTGLLLQAIGEAAIPEYNIYLNTEVGSIYRNDSSLDMIKNYISPSIYIDMMMFAKGNDITIYNATECAIGNPIRDNACKPSDMVGGFGEAAQKVIDEMFNKR